MVVPVKVVEIVGLGFGDTGERELDEVQDEQCVGSVRSIERPGDLGNLPHQGKSHRVKVRAGDTSAVWALRRERRAESSLRGCARNQGDDAAPGGTSKLL